MALSADLSRLTAAQLRTALIIATRERSSGERQRVLREYARRGIKPVQNPRKGNR